MTNEFQNINQIVDRLQKRSQLFALASNLSCYGQEFVLEQETGAPDDCTGKYSCNSEFGGSCTPKKDGNYHCVQQHNCQSDFNCGAFSCTAATTEIERFDCSGNKFSCTGHTFRCKPNVNCDGTKGFSCTNNVLCNSSNVRGEFTCKTNQGGFICGHPGAEPDAFFCQGKFTCESKQPPFTCDKTTSFECENQKEGAKFNCVQTTGGSFSCTTSVTCNLPTWYDCSQSGKAHDCKKDSAPSFNCQAQAQYPVRFQVYIHNFFADSSRYNVEDRKIFVIS